MKQDDERRRAQEDARESVRYFEANHAGQLAESLWHAAMSSRHAVDHLLRLGKYDWEVTDGRVSAPSPGGKRVFLDEQLNQRTGAMIFPNYGEPPEPFEVERAREAITAALDAEQRFFVSAMAALTPILPVNWR